MTPWTKSMSLVALALGCGMTIATTNARAEESEEIAEYTDAITNNDDAEHRLDLIDPSLHRRGYGSCYSYCDNLHARCLRSYYPPRPTPYLRRGEHREDRYNWNDSYRHCERRFDDCVAVCRGPILYAR